MAKGSKMLPLHKALATGAMKKATKPSKQGMSKLKVKK